MKLQKIGILAVTILILNSQAMEKPCTSIDGLSKDKTSYYSWLPLELRKELCKCVISDSPTLKWLLNKDAESVGFNAKRLTGHTDYVSCFAVDNKNNYLFSGSDDRTIKIWNLKTGKCEKTLHGHTGKVSCLAIDKVNNLLFSGSMDRTIKVWNFKKNGECEKTLEGHTANIDCLAVDNVNHRLFSGSADTTIKVWNLETGAYQQTLQGHTFYVTCLEWDKINKHLISGSMDRTIRIWNLENGKCEKILHGHTSELTCFALDEEHNRLFSGSWDKTIRIWNLESGEYEKTLDCHTKNVTFLEWDKENHHLLSGVWRFSEAEWESATKIKIWNINSGQCCYSVKLPDNGFIQLIDAGAGRMYCGNGHDIIINELEDASIKTSLDVVSMDKAYLLMAAYECFQNKKELDLKTNAWLHTAFMRLPSALQKIIREQVTVRLPWSSILFRLGSRRA